MNTRARAFDLLGTAVILRIDDPALADEIARLLAGLPSVTCDDARFLELRAVGGARWSLFEDEQLVRADMVRRDALMLTLWRLNRIASASVTHAVIHAGAVTLNGRAAILSGAMNSGKSTLVAALGRAGFGVLSDEHAPVELDGSLVHPYAYPIQLDQRAVGVLGGLESATPSSMRDPERVRILPDEIRKGSLARATEPFLLVFPAYSEGADGVPQPVGRPDALRLLARQTLNLPELGSAALEVLQRLVITANAYRLPFDDLATACAALRRLFEQSDERYVERPTQRSVATTIVGGTQHRCARVD
jgi:hypothetical protein